MCPPQSPFIPFIPRSVSAQRACDRPPLTSIEWSDAPRVACDPEQRPNSELPRPSNTFPRAVKTSANAEHPYPTLLTDLSAFPSCDRSYQHTQGPNLCQEEHRPPEAPTCLPITRYRDRLSPHQHCGVGPRA